VQFTVDDENLGTPAEAWSTSQAVSTAELLDLPKPRRAVIVAPHPDDEILGAGGLIQDLHRRRVEILVVAVTDGEASHPASEVVAKLDLRSIRAKESVIALRRLGVARTPIVRLHIPDGLVTKNLERLEAEIEGLLCPGDLCITPWDRDGHPDHDASGKATLNAARAVGVEVLHYLVWALHWADPETRDLPWSAVRRFDLSPPQSARKRLATLAFRSQILRWGGSSGDAPVLPFGVLRRHWIDHELLIDAVAHPSLPPLVALESRKEPA
jgi:LmbE family N-acetylglucosaminyl deacetylase